MTYAELRNKRTELFMAIETSVSMGNTDEVYYLLGKLTALDEVIEEYYGMSDFLEDTKNDRR